MEISIKIANLDQLKAAFQKAPSIAVREYGDAIDRTAKRIEADAKRKAPVNKAPKVLGGNLRQLISSRMTGKASAEIVSKASYSLYVDQDTRPHIIRAKNAKALANKRTGQIFGRVVKHPGTKGTNYFSGSVKGNEKFMNDNLKSAMQNVLNSIR